MQPVPTAIACQLCEVNRQTLAEVISAGDYPDAPATTKGRARLFDADQLVRLFVFGELMRWGLSASAAGGMSAIFLDVFRHHPEEATANIMRHADGSHTLEPGPNPPTESPIVSELTIHVSSICDLLAARFDDLNKIEGGD